MLRNELETRQSVLIEAMRFPLIVLVVFIHVLPGFLVPLEMNFTGVNIYHIISETFSHNIGRIAVPCFFLFSGFFFFSKLEKWNAGFYISQLKKRSKTLLIPYLLWNAIMIITIYAKQSIFSLLSLENKEDGIFVINNQSWFELFWQGPVNFPLWYLRDLICMTLLAPLFYYVFIYLKKWGMFILLVLYFTTWETHVKGLSMTAFAFFGIGAYYGIYKKNILGTCLRFKYMSILGALFFLCCVTCNYGNELHEYFIRPFIILGVITIINLMNVIIGREFWREILCGLSATVFFIYSVHEIYIINWIKGFFSRTSLVETGGGLLLVYVLIPIITIIICLGLYFFLDKAFPKTLAFMVGGRVKTMIKRDKNES